MDKKTKLWLGAGILGVGAYLLLKSKKATAVVSAPANLVGFDSESFYDPQTVRYGVGQGVFANQTGGMINSMDVKGAKAGSTNQGIFANQTGGMINSMDVKGAKAGSTNQGIFTDSVSKKGFVNQPFNFTGDTDPVGQRKMPFAARVGDNQKFNAGGPIADGAGNFSNAAGKEFFNPQTAKYGQNQGVFKPNKPRIKTPVEPDTETIVNLPSPKENMVGLINGPAVYSGAFGR
jgi:hypothetical protein